MRKWSRRFLKLFFTMVVAHIPFYAVSHMTVSHAAEPPPAGSSKESAYQEIERDGRLYVFASPICQAELEKSGALGDAIIKIGYGQDGETMIFDSEEAQKEYDSRYSKKNQSTSIINLSKILAMHALVKMKGEKGLW